jgi:tetratricopeptide (TPR) repeat protein
VVATAPKMIPIISAILKSPKKNNCFMKKKTGSYTLPLPILFTVFYLLLVPFSFAQDCKTQAANKPATLTKSTDNIVPIQATMKAAERAKMKPYLAKAETWVKNIVTNFKGAKLNYLNNFFPKYLTDAETTDPMFVSTGMKGHYQSKMQFFAYYCYDNNNKIFTEEESGSSVYVNFNNVFYNSFTTDGGNTNLNGKPLFQVIKKKRTEGRIDFYELLGFDNSTGKKFIASDFIILRNSDKPVFIPITRKEYIEQMLRDVDNVSTINTKLISEGNEVTKKIFELEMKVYKEQDKTYTPEKEAKRRKWFEEDQEKLKKSITKISPEANAAKDKIHQYLKKPTEWLNKSVKQFYGNTIYNAEMVTSFFESLDKIRMNGVGEIEEETAMELATINTAYFNKNLSNDVPQVIMVYLRNNGYSHMEKVANLVKKQGALDPLEAMLNPGKSPSPIVNPSEIVSTYSLKYLPKLKILTPLIIPAGMKSSAIPVTANYNNPAPAAVVNFTLPTLSAKLSQLPQLLTAENYTAYIQQLHNAISNAVKPNEKKKADDYVTNKKITQSNQMSSAAFTAWLQNAPTASLYLYSKAVVANPSDVLAANNFSAFLIMGGLPEKSIPLLEYWNRQKPGEASILANLGNAYYRLGNIDKSMNYLKQCVQKDSLHPTANKILCMMYLKKGDTKNAKDHGTKSLTGSYDEQVVSLLRQLDNKTKPGDIMSHWPVKEFPMLKRVKLPAMPSKLDEMELFLIDLAAEKKSLEITIANIESKVTGISEELQQKVLMASLTKGFSPLRVKAQYIIMDAMQTYQREMIRESDALKYNLQQVTAPFSAKMKMITKKYSDQLNKLEGGEAGDEDKIAALEMASCKEINAEKEKYLGDVSPLVNNFAQRQEYVSRKFYIEYANWAPYWMPQTTISFPSIQKDYLKDMLNILSQYSIVSKNNCEPTESPANKDGKLHIWEDEFCANFKGEIAMGPAAIKWDCNSWSVEGGEGIAVELTVNYSDDGSFEDFTIGAGPGVSWDIAGGGIAKIEAGASVKEFIKIGNNKATGKWEVKDFGLKADASVQGNIGTIKKEIKIVELSAAVNAGISAGGIVAPILNLK